MYKQTQKSGVSTTLFTCYQTALRLLCIEVTSCELCTWKRHSTSVKLLMVSGSVYVVVLYLHMYLCAPPVHPCLA